ncbi:hypothetical protein HEK616_84070 (plasmid) [Streptomyces nigrescens]|uniref:UmuC domain-containing protein n=1 Tax=Streptomyces nigrescens TaxID=1920 RepID=A0ABN6R969_STRNI|nr:hypothetical protein [Streptomyces nigrescens]BDM74920.1 hypothetical protein HEK616_84070 [Streptomyces nigrescens]
MKGHEPAEASILHLRCRPDTTETAFREVLALLEEFSPTVEALPPSAALVDLRGAVRFFSRSPYQLAETIRLRALARLGVDTRIGVSSTYTVAAMASALPGSKGVRLVPPGEVTSLLWPLEIEALHGIGPVQARTLRGYGLHTIGALAAMPTSTVVRLLGGRAGRLLHERSHGHDPRPVTPRRLPLSASERIHFPHDTLDPAAHRAALLDLVVTLGTRLRAQRLAATTISVTITLADRSTVTRSRRLPEASFHTEDLRSPAYRILDSFALQRARVRQIAARVEMTEAHRVARQISLDDTRESRLLLEPVIDKANARFGPGTVGPAATYRHAADHALRT